MVSHKHAQRLLLLAGTLFLATVAGAQESGRDNAAGVTLETVTVTGTRIQRPDFTSDSPIVSVGAEAMSQTGSTSIEHLLNQLPQFVPSVTTTSNNPGNSGQANLDLRGLGTLRNLVLLNGRRLAAVQSHWRRRRQHRAGGAGGSRRRGVGRCVSGLWL